MDIGQMLFQNEMKELVDVHNIIILMLLYKDVTLKKEEWKEYKMSMNNKRN